MCALCSKMAATKFFISKILIFAKTFLTAKAKKKVERRCIAITEVLFFRLVNLSSSLKL